MERIRKAIVAGFGAGVSAAMGILPSVLSDGVFDMPGDLSAVAGAFAAAAVGVGWLTWRVPNAE
jgi:NAD-dependent SIR2 family protein deacetylase